MNKPAVQGMEVTDLELAGKLLADEHAYCERCGELIYLWPPEYVQAHLHKEHSEQFWPQVAELWRQFQSDPDEARRHNQIQQMRAQFLVTLLANRHDLYLKLVAAGVIVKPRKG